MCAISSVFTAIRPSADRRPVDFFIKSVITWGLVVFGLPWVVGCGSTLRPITPAPAKGLVAAFGGVVFQLEDPIVPPPAGNPNNYGRDLDTRGADFVTVYYSGVSSTGEVVFTERIVANEWAPKPPEGARLVEGALGDRSPRTRDESRTHLVDLTRTRVLEIRKVRIYVLSASAERLEYDLRDVFWD